MYLERPLAPLQGLRGRLQRPLLALRRRHLHVEDDEHADHGAHEPLGHRLGLGPVRGRAALEVPDQRLQQPEKCGFTQVYMSEYTE